MTTQQHLDWLLSLLAPPYREAWRAHVWARAKEIAQDPEHADLTKLLESAMRSRVTDTATEKTT